jgi:hypothetical protein
MAQLTPQPDRGPEGAAVYVKPTDSRDASRIRAPASACSYVKKLMGGDVLNRAGRLGGGARGGG